MNVVRVWSFDYCDSNLGHWTREHHETAEAAKQSRQQWLAHFGWQSSDPDGVFYAENLDEDVGESCGEYGDVEAIAFEDYELSFDGIMKALLSADPN